MLLLSLYGVIRIRNCRIHVLFSQIGGISEEESEIQ